MLERRKKEKNNSNGKWKSASRREVSEGIRDVRLGVVHGLGAVLFRMKQGVVQAPDLLKQYGE